MSDCSGPRADRFDRARRPSPAASSSRHLDGRLDDPPGGIRAQGCLPGRVAEDGVPAEGIVGVQMLSLPHRWGGHTTEFFAIGTAVRPIREDHTIDTPSLVLPLTDR